MNIRPITFVATMLLCTVAMAQTPSGASNLEATAVPHTTVPFRIDDAGTKLPDIMWGLDLAWLSEGNVRRGLNFAGQEMIEIIRLPFQTTNTSALNGELTADQKTTLNTRIGIAKLAKNATINLNSDQMEGTLEQVTNWYRSTNSTTQATRWCELIDLTKQYVESKGLKVTSVSPFNEPDLTTWHQGSKADMLAICKRLRTDAAYKESFADVKLCGGNTLNNDRALEWYNYSKAYLDEGNTHQLAGSFDTFAEFYTKVKADGKTCVADELHNTMECMVASEYGLDKGIWWGTCDHTRSQFMKASRGTRMGYAENRSNWTAASVYRHTDGRVQGFAGSSERQAYDTDFRFAATDHDVFYNGYGPTREYILSMPGGTAYQIGQANAETLVNIQDGDDIMPAFPTTATTYKIVNRGSGLLITSSGNGKVIKQSKASGTAKTQRWVITPVSPRIGGDFSYFYITNVANANDQLDILNWSLSDGADIIQYNNSAPGDNEKWFLEYVEDGWFYIRSCHSGMALEVKPGNENQMRNARDICQGAVAGEASQQWRLIPADVTYDAVAPAAPSALKATPQAASVRLEWTASADKDLRGYIILRSTDKTKWNVINRDIVATSYIDNTTQPQTTYYYKVQAQDKSLNRSDASDVVTAAPTDAHECIAHIACDSLADSTPNGNHAAILGEATYTEGRIGQALQLDGSKQFLQLPPTIALSRDLTISGWFYWTGGSKWQRLFDFGLDTDHYFFVCPSNGNNSRMRLAVKNGGTEKYIDANTTMPTNQWCHVAVVFSEESAKLYLNGKAVATSTTITARPADFKPIFNYVGRSQFRADPMLKGRVDDIAVYNYAATPEEIAAIAEGSYVAAPTVENDAAEQTVYTLGGVRVEPKNLRPQQIYVRHGRKVLNR